MAEESNRRLLLISTSRTFDTGYLDHCSEAVEAHFSGCSRVLFVPYALADRDGYAATARERFAGWGLGLDSIHEADDAGNAVKAAEGVFIGGGNTFWLLKTLYEENLVEALRKRALGGMPYMGTSAGSNVACASIRTTNDMPIVYPPSFNALALVPFNLNPHFLDADPDSRHMGETRETRIKEFHEENNPPVLGLREGAWATVDGRQMVLHGQPGGRLFRRGQEAREVRAGEQLDFLLSPGA